jgi:hypothetical protein
MRRLIVAPVAAVVGVAVGVPCALAAARLMVHMLCGFTPCDPITMAAVAGALLAVGALLGYIPSRRPSKVQPMLTLRYE